VEIDEDFVEARANLGCVLEELGHHELAIAAFLGALQRHPDYPDVHYHLAGILDECGRFEEARDHWREFLVLAPDSPWASDARERLGFGN
jgi:tetratricopeptide (TPR) repeat protein